MSAASALATGFEPSPRLAETAVRQAMDKAGLERAGGVILFLSPDFSRRCQPAVLAAARAAGCLQVSGMVVPGLFTEADWPLDRPAAAALVLGDGLALTPAEGSPEAPLFSLASTALPADWQSGLPRFGLMHAVSPVWQAARLAAAGRAEASVAGARCHLAISTGLRRLGPAHAVEEARGHDLLRLGGLTAVESLSRALPPEIRQRSPLPVHLLGVVREGELQPAIAILAANADGSLTLAERPRPGERLLWALRQPLSAEADMAASLETVAAACPAPAFGLMCSCIGRGPMFYGDDDRDLAAFRSRFPGLPLLGAYAGSQIGPAGGGNRQWQNSVITALFETDHV
ncbi:MAG TPA: FIST C-terminal domain-containing protein [Rhodocyclaceae bacterium]|nr:FIST C-terminal domain-containing protein [Rhodocyclaceae bacterium]